MVDVKGFNGGMNQDSAPELLPAGDYTYALNISNGSEGIVNLLGNRPAGGFPANTNGGTEWICGAFFDKVRQRIIYFTNHSAGNHRIISYSVPSVSSPNGSYLVLFEDKNRVFDYWTVYFQPSPNGFIKDIRVVHREYEGDLYYFIDPAKKLRKFNYDTIQKWIEGDTTLCAYGWTNANYDGITLNDGTSIPQVSNNTSWETLTTPAWCYYNNDPANNAIYGKLYNWYAVSHPNFAPTGYRVPTDTDFTNLINCLGGASVAGGKMKNTGTQYWVSPNSGATNESLFNALPAGYRWPGPASQGFADIGRSCSFWTSTEYDANTALIRSLSRSNAQANRFFDSKRFGYSVRLIKQP